MNKAFTRESIIELATVSAITLLLFIGCVFIENYQTTYTMNAIVIGVENGKVLIEDDTNNIWEFIGEGYEINDVVAVKFHTHNTDNIREDDEIKSVKTLYHFTSNK